MRKFDVVLPVSRSDDDQGKVATAVDGVHVKALLFDSGADRSLVARGIHGSLAQAVKCVFTSPVDGIRLNPVGGRAVEVSRVATFKEGVLEMSAWPLMIRNLAGYVKEENLTVDLNVGRPIMKILGYSTDLLLAVARGTKPGWELGVPSHKD